MEKLFEMIYVQGLFKMMYNTDEYGLVAVSNYCVQLKIEKFRELFDNNPDYKVSKREISLEDERSFTEYSTNVLGVKIIAVCDYD